MWLSLVSEEAEETRVDISTICDTVYDLILLGIIFRPAVRVVMEHIFIKKKTLWVSVVAYIATIFAAVLDLVDQFSSLTGVAAFDVGSLNIFYWLFNIAFYLSVMEMSRLRSHAFNAKLINGPIFIRFVQTFLILVMGITLVTGSILDYNVYSDPATLDVLDAVNRYTDYSADLVHTACVFSIEVTYLVGFYKFISAGDWINLKKLYYPTAMYCIEITLIVLSFILSVLSFIEPDYDALSDVKRIAFTVILVDIAEFGATLKDIQGKGKVLFSPGHSSRQQGGSIIQSAKIGYDSHGAVGMSTKGQSNTNSRAASVAKQMRPSVVGEVDDYDEEPSGPSVGNNGTSDRVPSSPGL